MRLKDKYVNVLEQNGGSLGVRRSGERIATRWWYVGDQKDAAIALVHAAVDAAFEQAQAAHDECLVACRDSHAAAFKDAHAETERLRHLARDALLHAAPPMFLFSDAEEVNKLKTEIARLESVAKARDNAIQNLTAERDRARADNGKLTQAFVVAERDIATARRQYTDAFREAEDLRARLNGAKADKEVLQRKLAIAYEEKAQAEAKLRAAARGGGHAMGQDSSEERARDLDPVRRPGLRPGEGSWTRMARVFVEDSRAASVANAILEEQVETSVKVNEIVHKHGLEALDHALRDARYKRGEASPRLPQDLKLGRVAGFMNVVDARTRRLALSFPHGWPEGLRAGAFVDFANVEKRRINVAPVRVLSCDAHNALFEFWNPNDAHELLAGNYVYLAP